MPLVKPPRALSSVKCVKKVRDKNGDVRHDLKVLFDYVRTFFFTFLCFICGLILLVGESPVEPYN